MIDHILGRPSPSWKRTQVFLVILFWSWRITRGNAGPPRLFWLPKFNKALRRFTPWQIVLSTLTAVYALRNLDKILGLTAPEPLARLYSPSYYRATWLVTGLDAGFATAMSIRPKWLRDLCSTIFSVYYIIYANEADEKLRRFRAVPTVEMLRVTWEKTTNPYLRFFTRLPPVSIRRKILLPRPKSSSYDRPITAYLFFASSESLLASATDLILDLPGGGFIAMSPEHHEERLRMWAVKTGRPVLAVDYGKAPEYPYPFASDEVFDTYKLLVETNGKLLGMSGKKINVIFSGDSAGATIGVNAVVKVLEYNQEAHRNPHKGGMTLPVPLAIVLNYACLDLNFTSWMSADNLRVLRTEQSSGNLPGLKAFAAQKDHLQHVSPLSMVQDKKHIKSRRRPKRTSSWKETFRGFTSGGDNDAPKHDRRRTLSSNNLLEVENGDLADAESDDEDYDQLREEDRPIQARVKYAYHQSESQSKDMFPRSESALERKQEELSAAIKEANTKASMTIGIRSGEKLREAIGTRLTMTSRTGYFQDRIISPSMMRAMAIMYIGPHRNPDFRTDYHISPILAPPHLLAQFPPLLMQCGEKDPFVDDTIIFAGRVREAKQARKVELDLLLSGKSARFGESLQMSRSRDENDKDQSALRRERETLGNEVDWVQMDIYSDWSHGYLQMPTLMAEVKAVIEEQAEWIERIFSKDVVRKEASSGEITIISEGEVMRRRRLLDAHVFV